MNNLDIPGTLVDLIKNNQLGSRELLSKLNSELLKDQYNITQLRLLIPYLKQNFIQFQSIQNYLIELENYLTTNNDKDFLLLESQKILSIAENIFSKNKNIFEDKNSFVTLSNSSTIYDLIKIISRNKDIKVTISESRPICEGAILAEKLSEIQNIDVTLCTEAQLPEFVYDCDTVLIGADKILPDGKVINKVGSKLLSILADHYKKPFYVAADKSKFSDEPKFSQQQKPASEIYSARNKLIKITNQYFEIIDPIFITSVLTD